MNVTPRLLLGWLSLCALLLIGLIWLPLDGTILILNADTQATNLPLIQLEPRNPLPGETVLVTVVDKYYWSFTQLTLGHMVALPVDSPESIAQVYTWTWSAIVPEGESFELKFYVNCHSGCEERASAIVGQVNSIVLPQRLPTKLGVVLPNLERDWHNRQGWAVELTYATQSEASYWGVDDLASRVQQHREAGLNVIIRVDYDPSQSLPLDNDDAALAEYLAYLKRLARDDRLCDVYAFVIGSDMNVTDVDRGQQAITPAWYARLFLGYGQSLLSTDNAVQIIAHENPGVRVLVGPVRPWEQAQRDSSTAIDEAPWLSYMRVLTMHLDETVQAKSRAGISVSFDGFDVQAPANLARIQLPDKAEDEPSLHLWHESYPDAHVGFRVYEDWLDIINAYDSTRGMPVYIISTNTYQRDGGATPAETYVSGWLSNALSVINHEPQIKALCWFLDDFPNTDQWDAFSLTQAPGKLKDAAVEFDELLRGQE